MKKIKLTQGQYALVDDIDYPVLSKYKWYALKRYNNSYGGFYAVRNIPDITKNNRQTQQKMHRFIFNLSSRKKEVDHIDGDGLNNKRKNLRVCSRIENIMNSRIRGDNTTGLKNVTFYKPYNKYAVKLTVNGVRKFLGYFSDKKEAVQKYNFEVVKEHGEFALLNKI